MICEAFAAFLICTVGSREKDDWRISSSTSPRQFLPGSGSALISCALATAVAASAKAVFVALSVAWT